MTIDSLELIIVFENVAEVLVLSVNAVLSVRHFFRLKHCHKLETANLRIIFCLSDVYSITYGVTRTILLFDEYQAFLNYITSETLKRVRCFSLMWILYWLTFVSFERFIGTVLISDKHGTMERKWRITLLVSCHFLCLFGTIIDKIPDFYPGTTNEILVPSTVILSSFSIAGFFLLKRTNIYYYHTMRFAGLSTQFKISRNIRLLNQLEKWFILVFIDFTITNIVIIASYVGDYHGHTPNRPVFGVYLVLLAFMFTLSSLTALTHDVNHYVRKSVKPQDTKEVAIVNVLNQNIFVENTPENNFNALQQIWMETKSQK
ncbi:unnamed protein product [Bursaphelenchus xylophilus]|uniref:(pine wood nematode) hypothetical protein n=1 Tax=Bursaphelenchus xylophilus TaxID=6326 RepID=A0A1I7RW50_BURXY|nr:unnamed protein product [Bursaphelenchus xylophilus]CAG9095129.1 unnamed protein product [Bursaphelenchus xylophilus]